MRRVKQRFASWTRAALPSQPLVEPHRRAQPALFNAASKEGFSHAKELIEESGVAGRGWGATPVVRCLRLPTDGMVMYGLLDTRMLYCSD
jgi:hypothetical protein